MTSGGCPALYSTDDPGQMRAQGKLLTDGEMTELLELLKDETAGRIEAFIAAKEL